MGAIKIPITFVADTSAVADGDIITDTVEIPGAVEGVGSGSLLTDLVLVDQSDNTAIAIDIFLMRSNTSLGTKNAAPSISDTNALEIIGRVRVADTDWIDIGGAKIATLANLGITLVAGTGSSIYASVVARGAATYAASAIRALFGVIR